MRSRSFASAFRTCICWWSATVRSTGTWRSRVAEHDLRDCVTLVGSVPHADTPALLSGGRCVRAVVGVRQFAERRPRSDGLRPADRRHRFGGVREFVADTSAALIVPTGDARALADALERYLANPELARAAGDHNRARKRRPSSRGPRARVQLREVYRTTIDDRAAATTATSA